MTSPRYGAQVAQQLVSGEFGGRLAPEVILDIAALNSAISLALMDVGGNNILWSQRKRVAFRWAVRYLSQTRHHLADKNLSAAGSSARAALSHLTPWRGVVASATKRQISRITSQPNWI